MKKVLLASLIIVGAAGIARADHDDRPGRDWIPLADVTQKLHDMGFTQITKIEADDGFWEAKGYRDGVYTKVKLDPRDGHLVRQRRVSHEHHDDDD